MWPWYLQHHHCALDQRTGQHALEQSLFEASECGDNAWFSASCHLVQFQLGGKESCEPGAEAHTSGAVSYHPPRLTRDIFRISRCTSTTAVNALGEEVNLFTVLVGDDGTFRGASVGTQHHAILPPSYQAL